ncbi:amino acid deaminase [Microbacterium sp. gxy059]|uniref:amino acid deaminase n=1 Tax=Microbacterium sp. gxy059 TaxID=2957199 RepID=UPI003D96452F
MTAPPALDEVLACVRRDAREGLLDAWAWSTVMDEHVGGAVVDEEIVRALHETAGGRFRFPVGHAGLLHVYGYLFSTVRTPFGGKSDRWNDGVLATRLGREPGAFRLGDSPDETPLARVTSAGLPLLLDPPDGAVVRDEAVGGLRTRAVVVPAPDGSGVLVSGTNENDGLRLVTLFPVADAEAFAADVAASPPRLRWNAAPRP